MSTPIFDTHAFVEKLTSNGMPKEEAEVVCCTIHYLLAATATTAAPDDNAKVATREDVASINARLTNIETRLGFMEERLAMNDRVHTVELELEKLKARVGKE